MLDLLLSGGLGTVLGGITGLIGTWLNNKKELELQRLRVEDKQADRKHEIAMGNLDMKAKNQAARLKMEETVAVNEHEQELSADANFKQSYVVAETEIDDTEHHSAFVRFLFGVVEVLRRMIRVTASYGSMVILGYITYFVYNNLDKFLLQLHVQGDGDNAFNLMQYLVFTICYISTTIILWWFGVRNKRPAQL